MNNFNNKTYVSSSSLPAGGRIENRYSDIALSNKLYINLACRQSEESRFPSRRGVYPDEGRAPQDDAGRLEDRQA